ncbi:hypothetical protein [Streptomyces mobaraensis]|uniref:Secreted protein n=1 Tax=Streptomyces mobaraensis TaxID=35621 RepID=A0A5N5W165_STRMB|nr:hypothetical protein [Streptomyces mobaraensis]KAB7834339.1 hypothetical protein FRZ00_30575 [Streptomyces mobaraensis]
MTSMLKKTAVLAACVAALTTGAAALTAGTAHADTGGCSATLPAHTNGNAANDTVQQGNAAVGAVADLVKCTVTQGNKGLNGADDDAGLF